MSNPSKKRIALLVGIFLGFVVLVFVVDLFYRLLSNPDNFNTEHGCLQTGRYTLRQVYLDSMLYVNGSETQRLARFDVTQLFTGNQTITLDLNAEIGMRVRGQARINYPNGYGIEFKAS